MSKRKLQVWMAVGEGQDKPFEFLLDSEDGPHAAYRFDNGTLTVIEENGTENGFTGTFTWRVFSEKR